MSEQEKPRPVPADRKVYHDMYAFGYEGVTYFASKLPAGWSVVSEDRQEEPIAWNQPSKVAAKRLALDRIDRYGADYRPTGSPSGVHAGTTGATT